MAGEAVIGSPVSEVRRLRRERPFLQQWWGTAGNQPNNITSQFRLKRRPLRPLRSALPFSVSAHQPDAKMPERRLSNLLRMVDTRAHSLDRVYRRNRHRITGHAGHRDRHSGRHMDDPASAAIFGDREIAARVIACHAPLSTHLNSRSGSLTDRPENAFKGAEEAHPSRSRVRPPQE